MKLSERVRVISAGITLAISVLNLKVTMPRLGGLSTADTKKLLAKSSNNWKESPVSEF